MKKDFPPRIATAIVLLAVTAISGCGTNAAKNFGGSWQPVNRFQARATQIPLSPSYRYYASPMDETLKTMLSRWSKDSGRILDYQLDFDVTLYQPVADVHTTDIHVAASQLSAIYAAEGVLVAATNRRIEVTRDHRLSTTEAADLPSPAGKK